MPDRFSAKAVVIFDGPRRDEVEEQERHTHQGPSLACCVTLGKRPALSEPGRPLSQLE